MSEGASGLLLLGTDSALLLGHYIAALRERTTTFTLDQVREGKQSHVHIDLDVQSQNHDHVRELNLVMMDPVSEQHSRVY